MLHKKCGYKAKILDLNYRIADQLHVIYRQVTVASLIIADQVVNRFHVSDIHVFTFMHQECRIVV